MCIPDDKYIYFIDAGDGYKLKRISQSRSDTETVTIVNERISTYNIGSNFIYFQIDDEEGKLCRIKKNNVDEEYEVITTGHYNNINVTSKYVYFYKMDVDNEIYRIPTTGSPNVKRLSEILGKSLYK